MRLWNRLISGLDMLPMKVSSVMAAHRSTSIRQARRKGRIGGLRVAENISRPPPHTGRIGNT